jgi:hypothetical protein
VGLRRSASLHLRAVERDVADCPARRDCEVNVARTLNVLEAATRHRAPTMFADGRRATATGAGTDFRGDDPGADLALRRLELGRRGVRDHVERADAIPHASAASETSTALPEPVRRGRCRRDLQPLALARRLSHRLRLWPSNAWLRPPEGELSGPERARAPDQSLSNALPHYIRAALPLLSSQRLQCAGNHLPLRAVLRRVGGVRNLEDEQPSAVIDQLLGECARR